jgi:hypothetical protein
MRRVAFLAVLIASALPSLAAGQPFKLAPAVAVEAEDFTVEKGWKVLNNGAGNYMVDIIGFCHISGERLLGIDEKDDSASAFLDITVPQTGKYRLWARYEYPAFCETRFRVLIQQGGKTVLDQVMGKKDSLRYAFGEPAPKAQHDPAWGPEGLMEEAATIAELKAGKARIYLKSVKQPQTPGVAAHRNIDLLYLTRDTTDAWMKHYRKTTNLYPILDAFRDSRGARWEVRFTNRAAKPADFAVTHVYNRLPWGLNEAAPVRGVKPGAASGWVGLRAQDTAHFGMTSFTSSAGAFDLEVRPAGGAGEAQADRRRPAPAVPAALLWQGRQAHHPQGGHRRHPRRPEEAQAHRQEAHETALLWRLDAAGAGQRLRPQVRRAVRSAGVSLAAPGAQRDRRAQEPGESGGAGE